MTMAERYEEYLGEQERKPGPARLTCPDAGPAGQPSDLELRRMDNWDRQPRRRPARLFLAGLGKRP